MDPRLSAFLSLFASTGTLVCCALPSLLVLLGLGTTVASLTASLPWLVDLSRHKEGVFAGSGLLLLGAWYYQRRVVPRLAVRGAACPPEVSRLSFALWRISVGLWMIGLGVAYVLPVILRALA